jgi:hypothetical protein
MWSKNMMLLASVLIVLAACAAKVGGSAPPPVDNPDQAAANALVTLQKLVTEANYKDLGFDSVDQVNRAVLAVPMPVFEIGLDRIRSYQPGQDVNSLLTPSMETIYPVTVDGQTKSSVTVVKKASGYLPASFGNAAVVVALSRYRGNRPEESFTVHIPVPNMYFLGTRTADRLMLTPVIESSQLPLRVGVAVPAEEVIQAIVPLVQEYNGLPI